MSNHLQNDPPQRGSFHTIMLTETQQEDFDLMVIREEFAWRRSLPTKHQLRTMFGVRTAHSRGRSGADKEAVREKTDMVRLYQHLFPEKPAPRFPGRRYVSVSCPFHGTDRLPSMSLDTERKSFRCHTCSESGDLYALTMKATGLGFWAAVQEVDRVG